MRLRLLKKNLLIAVALSFIFVTIMFTARVFVYEDGDGTGSVAREDAPPATGDIANFLFGSVPDMIQSVYNCNYKQCIHNADKFPGEPQLVLVIQVHNRPDYLRILINSLENTAQVQTFLLIFSHDYFSEEINSIVQGITFCKVLQIYFPFSTQLYPSEFPGQDPRDCPRDMAKEEALRVGCLNAEHPDSYGHYREASITQTKHHWWWKMHFVWERVQVLQGYSGFAIFLEEDNFVLPDLLHLYVEMLKFRKDSCPDCDMLVLGNHNAASADFVKLSNRVVTAEWMSTKHNMGMAFSREVYYKLMGCSDAFCTYDDYNWDWTLQRLSGTCISKPLKVLLAEGSRVLHTGNCGLHQKEDCRPDRALRKAEEALRFAKDSLFPHPLVLSSTEPVEHRAHIKNGGWGDIRDHILCKNYAKRL